MTLTKEKLYWIMILLIIILSAIVSIYSIKHNKIKTVISCEKSPMCKSEHSNTLIYNSEGILVYNLISQYIEHFSEQNATWFSRPKLVIYDDNKNPIWIIKSNQAKLTNNHTLYLHGNVIINSLNINFQLQKITTDSIQINLITQDITSQNPVILYGTTFHSSGLQMYGNLRKKNAKLIKNVKTFYKIKKKQTKP